MLTKMTYHLYYQFLGEERHIEFTSPYTFMNYLEIVLDDSQVIDSTIKFNTTDD